VTGHLESNDPALFPDQKDVPGFKDAFDLARLECARLAEKILTAIAIYLGIPRDDLVRRHKNLYWRSMPSQTVMRSSMYSPMEDHNLPKGAIRCGEHCDWHTITLLFQDMIGGLEVKTV